MAFARRTWTGGTQTLATSYSAASRQPASTNASSSSGLSRLWSMVLAMSRSVKLAKSMAVTGSPGSRGSMAVRPEDVASDQEALLHLLVGALEAAVFVFDDAIAVV